MGAVGLFFAPLAPLVVVAAAIVFWISSWVYKYQLMFVFVSKTESGGVSTLQLFCGRRLRIDDRCLAYVERRHQSPALRSHPHAMYHDPQYVYCGFARRCMVV